MAPLKKKGKAAQTEQVTLTNPRQISLADRRELFLKGKAEEDPNNWKIVRADATSDAPPYGFVVLDHACRLRQLPRGGRVIQIHGDEGAGKSTLSYGIAAAYQRLTGGEPVDIEDFEKTATWPYLTKIGVQEQFANLHYPTGIPEASANIIKALKQGVRFFICDSIPRMKNTIPEEDILDGSFFKDNQPGQHAKAMTKFFDAVLNHLAEYDATLVMINQTRARIESSNEARLAQKYPTFTNLPYVLPGGKDTRFIMSVMIELKRSKAWRIGESIHDDPFILEPSPNGPKDKGDFLATEVRCRILKNKTNDGGFREGILYHRAGFGFDDMMSLRHLAREYGLIEFAGRKWFVGEKDNPIATYGSKEAAIEDLVTTPNVEVLTKLRPLVEKAVAEDQSHYNTSLDATEKAYLEGEVGDFDDAAAAEPVGTAKNLNFED